MSTQLLYAIVVLEPGAWSLEPGAWSLEPGAAALIDEIEADQRSDLQALTRRLIRAGRLRPGFGEARAVAMLHVLTSLESFLRLRRTYGFSLRQTHETIAEVAVTLLRDRASASRSS
jgi:hypothetical protein